MFDLDKVYHVYFLVKHLKTSSLTEIALGDNLILFSLKKLFLEGSCSTRQPRALLLMGRCLGLPFDLLQGEVPFWFMYSKKISKIFFLLGIVVQLCGDLRHQD